MAKPLVTQQQVNESADALVSTGQEPTILTVQERIGAGSYSTIKKYLDVWKQQRSQAPVVELPAALAEQGTTLLHHLWAEAVSIADHKIAQVQTECQRQVTTAQQAQAEAEAAVTRLEATLEERERIIAERDQTLITLQAELDQARRLASEAQVRAQTLEQHVTDLRAQLERQSTPDYQQLAAEMAALKQQIAQITPQPAANRRAKPENKKIKE